MDKDSFQRLEGVIRNAAYLKSIFEEEDSLHAQTPNQRRIRGYVETVYQALDKLSSTEMDLIRARYMTKESEYQTDGDVIEAMNIKRPDFTAIRRQAFDKLADQLFEDVSDK